MKKIKKTRNRFSAAKLRFIINFTLAAILVVLVLRYVNARVMPTVLRTMEMHGENQALKAIDGAVRDVIKDSGLSTADLYTKSVGDSGKLTSLSANTLLINTLCSDVAEEILNRLEKIGDQTVTLPLGIITGIDFLSTKGPPFLDVTVKPMGHSIVNYETSFKSEGINQVNYQIWLDIRTRIAVVNPVISNDFYVERSLPIVNTYISGDVPDSMMYPFRIE